MSNQDWDQREYDSDFEQDVYEEEDPNDDWVYTEDWYYVPGPYVGLGPRDYQRDDRLIEEDVNDRLTEDSRLDASNISFGVSDGLVELNGSVHSRFEKRLAQDLAYSVFGVTDVQNNLKFEKEGSQTSRSWQQDTQQHSQPVASSPVTAQDLPNQGQSNFHQSQMMAAPQTGGQSQKEDWQSGQPRHWSESEQSPSAKNTNMPAGQVTSQNQSASTNAASSDQGNTPCGEIHRGMEVLGNQGKYIGLIKEIRDHDFLVNRPMRRDVYVPFDACQQVNGKMVLKFSADDIDNQGWPKPKLL